jgi:hypothetical protein
MVLKGQLPRPNLPEHNTKAVDICREIVVLAFENFWRAPQQRTHLRNKIKREVNGEPVRSTLECYEKETKIVVPNTLLSIPPPTHTTYIACHLPCHFTAVVVHQPIDVRLVPVLHVQQRIGRDASW